MKKVISLVLALVLTLSVVSFSAFAADVTADVVISADEVKTTYEIGKTIQVPVSIDSNNGLAVGRVTVTWDYNSLALTSVTFGSNGTLGTDNNSPMEGPDDPEGKPTVGIKNDGSYPISFGDYLSATGWDTTGKLFTLNFEVLEDASLGSYEIGLSGIKDAFLDADMNEKAPAFNAGEIILYQELNIGSLSFNVPTKGATPDTTASVNGNFSASTITWTDVNGNAVDGTFAAGTVYKASITLTAMTNCEFADDFAVTAIEGITPTVEIKSATEALVTFTFGATEQKNVQTISASDISVVFGDNAETLTATTDGDGAITYEVASGENVIAIVGDKVSFLKAGTATIKISAQETDDYKSAEKIINVTVAAADYTYTVSENTQYIREGSGLNAIAVSESGVGVNDAPVSGTLKWYIDAERTVEASDSDLVKGSHTLYWAFVTSDDNYVTTPKTGSITVNVVGTGDVNGDGKVSDIDAMILFRFLDEWDGYEEKIVCMDVADITCDGDVTDADAMYLARALAGWANYVIE